MAVEFPGLTGDDPTLEPASRMRARYWIEKALRLTDERGDEADPEADLNCPADAHTLVQTVRAGQDLPADWPLDRLVAASAQAASAILHSVDAAECAEEVFGET